MSVEYFENAQRVLAVNMSLQQIIVDKSDKDYKLEELGMNYTGQTSFAEMFEYYCTRNVTNEREYNEREMMRWAKDRIQQAHREGWEQCQMECVDIAEEHASNPSVGAVAEKIADAIAAMEYGGEK